MADITIMRLVDGKKDKSKIPLSLRVSLNPFKMNAQALRNGLIGMWDSASFSRASREVADLS
jgi:hypothetical protein